MSSSTVDSTTTRSRHAPPFLSRLLLAATLCTVFSQDLYACTSTVLVHAQTRTKSRVSSSVNSFSYLPLFIAWSRHGGVQIVPPGSNSTCKVGQPPSTCSSELAPWWLRSFIFSRTQTCDMLQPELSHPGIRFRPPLSVLSTLFQFIMELFAIYVGFLERAPLLTTAITAAIIGCFGDLCAQYFEQSTRSRRRDAKRLTMDRFVVDKNRSLAVVVDGLILSGPSLHILYAGLEDLFPTSSGSIFAATMHVMADEFIFDPVFVVLFFLITGVLERRDFRKEIIPQIRREYWPAVRSTWGLSFIFGPLQFLSFRFLPLQYRVLTVNIMDVLWTAVVSFFSHKEEDKEESAEAEAGQNLSNTQEGKGRSQVSTKAIELPNSSLTPEHMCPE